MSLFRPLTLLNSAELTTAIRLFARQDCSNKSKLASKLFSRNIAGPALGSSDANSFYGQFLYQPSHQSDGSRKFSSGRRVARIPVDQISSATRDASITIRPATVIDTTAAMAELVDTLAMLASVEKEGNPWFHLKYNAMEPHRQFFLIHQPNGSMTYLIDLNAFAEPVFSVPGMKTPWTMKGLLESNRIHKVVFDLRMISYILYKDFSIVLDGVQDLQLMHRLALSKSRKDLVSGSKSIKGFVRCVDDLYRSSRTPQKWSKLKLALSKQKRQQYNSERLTLSRFRPTSYERFSRMDAQLIQYQVPLKQLCEKKISAKNLELLKSQTLERLQFSRSVEYSMISNHERFMAAPPNQEQ
ncbi:Ribonuclease H-like protein [Glarea lozoyensis ATCC 20868]|uniref:Ribonuclease H-like protein n=1 Tax=Glarea lozoyensis (strain ATCC 20868 / MF5171) TaxID=1116229 RepID=S3CJA0_GLAL2|nr:Ribonuclease H-like protein [Glarea lozoyensis ATCC 20868]EPE25870.1 Ribonuclease H-like protein [Glarea lozoyensis ATCC 20868]